MAALNRASKVSAGLVMYRRKGSGLELLLVHPGGPFFARKDDGVWTIPKGLVEADEDLLTAAKREFHEETGLAIEADAFTPLGTVVQKGSKVVHAWAFRGDCDPASIRSNEFEIEWPPRSGRTARFPEIDRAGFFTVGEARRKILPAQAPFIDRIVQAFA